MRELLYALPVLLAACAAAPPPPSEGVPVRGAVPGGKCNPNADVSRFMGQPASEDLGSKIMAATESALLRWVNPDTMVTMEFNESRVTVHLDSSNRVARIVCG